MVLEMGKKLFFHFLDIFHGFIITPYTGTLTIIKFQPFISIQASQAYIVKKRLVFINAEHFQNVMVKRKWFHFRAKWALLVLNGTGNMQVQARHLPLPLKC